MFRVPEVRCPDTEWSNSHATHIKIFIGGCNSVQFDCVNEDTISLWLYRSRHVVTCSRQSVSCLQKVEVARMYFSQVQRVFIVENYLACRSYITCQNEFRDTFPDSPVPNKAISRLLNRFRSLQKIFAGLHGTWGKQWIHASLNAVDISNT
jgi:hypothetical protein